MQTAHPGSRLNRGIVRYSTIMLLCCVAAVLSACKTVKVDAADFLVPDSQLVARKRTVPSTDLAALRERLPGTRLEELDFKAEDGTVLRGLAYRHPAAKATVLVYGNNAFRVAQQGHVIVSALSAVPVNVVQFDYRGYGRSGGQPTIANMQSDALRVYDQLRSEMDGPLVIHGHSLGSFVASFVASQRKPDALVLEGTTTSAEDFIRGLTPWYARPFVRYDIEPSLKAFDNRTYLKDFDGKLLVLTGEHDRTTLPLHGERLVAVSRANTKTFFVVPNADHMTAMRKPEASAAYAALLAQLTAASR